MAKDLFSEQSKTYAAYRPLYPKQLFDHLMQFVEVRSHAWDCATGNGQAATMLADYFDKVEASDISAAQVSNATARSNIEYHVCPSEKTPFADNSFDLITVAQAYHWLKWKKFKEEAERVGKQNAVVAAWGYNLPACEDESINRIIGRFYRDITGPYWDDERRYVDEEYASVDFDFVPLPARRFVTTLKWNRTTLKGYLQSWSAVQSYLKRNHYNPVDIIASEIDAVWKETEEKEITFPIFMRIGRIIK